MERRSGMKQAIWIVILAAAAFAVVGTGPVSADFTEKAEFGAGATIPVAWGDYDGDQDLDLAVGNFGQQNWLFVNNGDTVFTQEDQFGALSTFAVVWGDYDNDGDLDMAVGNGRNEQNSVYINNGDRTFTLGPGLGKKRTNAIAWGDYDNDGDLDAAIGNGLLCFEDSNKLFENNGDGTFTSRSEFGQGQSASLV
jgi:hypothetical protein